MTTRFVTLGLAATLLAGCGGADDGPEPTALSGSVAVDGSSTVAPISEAVAEEFQVANQGVRVTVGIAGTGGGFKRFCAGETDISDASRPITDEEKAACAAAGIEWIEMPVAWDGLSVVVNSENAFVSCLTSDSSSGRRPRASRRCSTC